MNAITVNYAEVGNDHLPVSFGLVRDIDLNSQTVYNSKITKIGGTAYSVLQSRDIGTKDIIVSSDAKSSRLLSNFTSGPTSWINHRIPDSDSTAYIFYKDDGYYYKMVEDENGRPVQTKYAPYAYLTGVRDNAGIQPYCEATIEAPVELQVSTGSIKAVIDNNPVEIISIDHSLNLQLENADNDNFTSQSVVASEYTIGSDFNLENIEWTRDTQAVSPWLSGNKIIKSSKSSNGMTDQIKLLAGNNLVKIFRKRAQLTVHFTFNGDASSFEAAGAYCNNNENSYMNGNDLIVPQVKYGRSAGGSLLNFITNADTTWFNNIALLSSEFKGAITENRTVTISMPDIVDKIMFTGWYGNKVVSNQEVLQQHKTLKTIYELTGIDNNNLSNIAVTDNGGLLTWNGSDSKRFTRHRQLRYIHWERNGDEVGYINSDKFLKEDRIIVDDTTTPGTYDVGGSIWMVPVIDDRKCYIYADENAIPRTFYAEAHYNGIPSAVPVTAISYTAAATADQVVLFRGNYYVKDQSMQTLVNKLTGVTPIIATEHYDDWSVDKYISYYELTWNSSENAYDYKQCRATITFSGNGSQIASVVSSTSDVAVQLERQTVAENGSISAPVKATVVNPDLTSHTDGFSFNGPNAGFSTEHEEFYFIEPSQWRLHYQFF